MGNAWVLRVVCRHYEGDAEAMERTRSIGDATPCEPERYPTLRFIERSIGSAFRRFSGASNADELETLARRLTQERWSPSTWERGQATDAELGAVLAPLSAMVDQPDEPDPLEELRHGW